MPLIIVDRVSKTYPSRRGPRRLKAQGGITDWLRGRRPARVAVLQDISLTVERGEAVGIIGRNGSGKSTLLKMLAGVTLPTEGEVTVNGRVASLLELGAGFHPNLTGRENVYLNAGILGMRHAQVDAVMDLIIGFSGIGPAIDHPVDTYSSGMFVRLAFSVAVYTNPDIFLVDEVLSVGDEEFQRKCRKRIGELREQGKTIVFVSHDLASVAALCNRVILLSEGRMVSRPTPRQTIDYYLRQLGRASGVRTLRGNRIEAIFNHGQLALFFDEHEVTGARGLFGGLTLLGGMHDSCHADWEVTEASETYFKAEGTMPRLPVRLDWETWLEGDCCRVAVSLTCLQEVKLDRIFLRTQLPQAYHHWMAVDREFEAPDIPAGQTEYTYVMVPQAQCKEVLALPDTGAPLPPVRVLIAPRFPNLLTHIQNSDYISAARVLEVYAPIPQDDPPLAPGNYPLTALTYDLGQEAEAAVEALRRWQARRTLEAGDFRFNLASRGCIEVAQGDLVLTRADQAHTAACVGNMWSSSLGLKWEECCQEGGGLVMEGVSTRFSFRQIWEIVPTAGGLHWKVCIESEKPLDVQEYDVAISLAPGYDAWATPLESGAFPDFDPEDQEWRHANRDFAPCAWIRASGPGLPAVALRAAGELEFHMSAVNTGYAERARVLQAIRSPGRAGALHFAPGRHLWFEGELLTGEAATVDGGALGGESAPGT